jgi:hypothetical protein
VYAAKMGNAGGEAELPTGEFGERPMGERPTGDWPGEFGERPTGEFGDMPGMDMPSMPDREIMQEAMQILTAANFEFTDKVKASLLKLGLTEEQMEMLANMQNRGPRGGNMP